MQLANTSATPPAAWIEHFLWPMLKSSFFLSIFFLRPNPFTTGNPFLGTKLLGSSIGRGSGALKGLSPPEGVVNKKEQTSKFVARCSPLLRRRWDAPIYVHTGHTRHVLFIRYGRQRGTFFFFHPEDACPPPEELDTTPTTTNRF